MQLALSYGAVFSNNILETNGFAVSLGGQCSAVDDVPLKSSIKVIV